MNYNLFFSARLYLHGVHPIRVLIKTIKCVYVFLRLAAYYITTWGAQKFLAVYCAHILISLKTTVLENIKKIIKFEDIVTFIKSFPQNRMKSSFFHFQLLGKN